MSADTPSPVEDDALPFDENTQTHLKFLVRPSGDFYMRALGLQPYIMLTTDYDAESNEILFDVTVGGGISDLNATIEGIDIFRDLLADLSTADPGEVTVFTVPTDEDSA